MARAEAHLRECDVDFTLFNYIADIIGAIACAEQQRRAHQGLQSRATATTGMGVTRFLKRSQLAFWAVQ